MRPQLAIEALRERIATIEGRARRTNAVLPFGLPALDSRLPGGGLSLGALHEIAGGGNGALDGAAAALFAAGIAARTKGKVLWCIVRSDLFAPALAQAGLAADRVIYVEAGDDRTVLACMEEGLRHGGPSVVIAEIARLTMTASRRLQLAAEGGGTHRPGAAAVASADRGHRLRATHGGHDPLAGFGVAVDAIAGPGRRPASLAGGADPGAGWREC